MVAQLNRLMSLLVLCGLLIQSAMAAPSYQTLVVNGDTLMVQMAEPRLAYKSPLAASSDSLSALKTSPQAAVGDRANATAESLLNSVFMGEPFRFSAAVSDSAKDDMRPDKRIFNKQISGALGGLVGGAAVIAMGSSSDAEELAGILAVSIGYSLGTAIGVSKIDPHDRFITSLGGSALGLIGGFVLTSASEVLFPSLFVGPVIGATAMSEWSRKPPQARRVSVGLVPDPRGHLSAVATLRF